MMILGCVLLCSDQLPSGRQWRNGLGLFHGLELCSALELLLRSGCLTELDPELVVEALSNCPSFAVAGLLLFRNVLSLLIR